MLNFNGGVWKNRAPSQPITHNTGGQKCSQKLTSFYQNRKTKAVTQKCYNSGKSCLRNRENEKQLLNNDVLSGSMKSSVLCTTSKARMLRMRKNDERWIAKESEKKVLMTQNAQKKKGNFFKQKVLVTNYCGKYNGADAGKSSFDKENWGKNLHQRRVQSMNRDKMVNKIYEDSEKKCELDGFIRDS